MNDYQEQIESQIQIAQLPAALEISYKLVFGARAAYANGHIFATCGKFGFALKLPEKVCQELFDNALATPLKYFEKGHVKRNYAVLNEGSRGVQARLAGLIADSVKFALEDSS